MSQPSSENLVSIARQGVDWVVGLPGRIRESLVTSEVARPPAIRKVSDRAIEREMHIVWKRYERAQGWSKGVRQGLIVFGVTTAIFLPLLEPNSQSDSANVEVEVKPVITTPVTVINPHDGGGGGDSDQLNFDEGDTYIHYQTVPNNTNVYVAPQKEINWVPIESDRWHRPVFNNENDVLWVIPDADLRLNYIEGDGVPFRNLDIDDLPEDIDTEELVKRCEDNPEAVCRGEFEFTTADFRGISGLRFAFEGSQFQRTVQLPCRNKDFNREQMIQCDLVRVERVDENGEPAVDLCLQVKRSAHLETERTDGRTPLALDVRWGTLRDDGECQFKRFVN